jgi:hypothetical protein
MLSKTLFFVNIRRKYFFTIVRVRRLRHIGNKEGIMGSPITGEEGVTDEAV